MTGFTDPELYAQDLSFMTDEDFARLFKANDERAIRKEQYDKFNGEQEERSESNRKI